YRGRGARMARRGENRVDVVAASARTHLVEWAGLVGNEVTGYRASTRNALEAQTEETSRESCCHRFGVGGIAGLRSWTRRIYLVAEKVPDGQAQRARGKLGAEPDRDGDVGRSVSDRRRGEGSGSPGANRPGDTSTPARGGRPRGQERSEGRATAQQGVLADGRALGTHSVAGGEGDEVAVRSSRRARGDAAKPLEQRARLDAYSAVESARRQDEDAAGTAACARGDAGEGASGTHRAP